MIFVGISVFLLACTIGLFLLGFVQGLAGTGMSITLLGIVKGALSESRH